MSADVLVWYVYFEDRRRVKMWIWDVLNIGYTLEGLADCSMGEWCHGPGPGDSLFVGIFTEMAYNNVMCYLFLK